MKFSKRFIKEMSGHLQEGALSMISFNEPIMLEKAFTYVREAINNKKLSGDGEFTKRCSYWLERWVREGPCVFDHFLYACDGDGGNACRHSAGG